MKKPKSKISLMVLRCSAGHEWQEALLLPMSLEAYCSRLRGIACCPKCADRKTVMLLGKEYEKAKARLEKI